MTHYEDGQTFERPIEGVFRQTGLEHLRPVYGFPVQKNITSAAETKNNNKDGEKTIYNGGSPKVLNGPNASITTTTTTSTTTTTTTTTMAPKLDYQYEGRSQRDGTKQFPWIKTLAASSSSKSFSQIYFLPKFIFLLSVFAQVL